MKVQFNSKLIEKPGFLSLNSDPPLNGTMLFKSCLNPLSLRWRQCNDRDLRVHEDGAKMIHHSIWRLSRMPHRCVCKHQWYHKPPCFGVCKKKNFICNQISCSHRARNQQLPCPSCNGKATETTNKQNQTLGQLPPTPSKQNKQMRCWLGHPVCPHYPSQGYPHFLDYLFSSSPPLCWTPEGAN